MRTFPHKGLYAIVDSTIHQRYGLVKLLENIVKRSTIPVIQLRLKAVNPRNQKALILRALELKDVRHFTLIINDDMEMLSIATKTARPDGLHLGQKDINVRLARRAYPDRIMGQSTHDLNQAKKAKEAGADYIGCGAVFPTKSKAGAELLGPDGLRQITREIALPKVAIGGITLQNIDEVARTGCEMAAVISGLIDDRSRFVGQELHERFLECQKKFYS